MKNTIFYWGWQNYNPTIDSAMTRARMARLMRAYTVTTRGYFPEDAAKIIVITGKNNAQN